MLSLLAFRGPSLALVAVAGVILLLVAVRLWAVPSAERARLVYMVSNYYLITVFSALLIAKQYPAG